MDKECFLCKSKEKDEVKFGEFMTCGKISVHYFCLVWLLIVFPNQFL